MYPQPFEFGPNSINKDWALKVGKEKFIKHFKDVYPDADLEAEWNKISPPKKEKEDKK